LQTGISKVKTIDREVDELLAIYTGLIARDRQAIASGRPYASALAALLSILMSGVWDLDHVSWQDMSRAIVGAIASMGTLLQVFAL
jgi:hypothetical protein